MIALPLGTDKLQMRRWWIKMGSSGMMGGWLWIYCPVIQMTDDDVEQYWTQYWPLECTTSHWLELCANDGSEEENFRLQILSFAKIAVGIFKAARLQGLAFTGPDMSL
ncbi:hypothetical protein HGM15179_007863 [Zosterops borbonicus]|uniref:Uncharacterized protein n=1 Tax=Zosterops borbonicus TaxID=364589 RepID=A0A8K1LM13_9PASS|nr:hypothetical protein HGM15179_007863 [Zosterops borbonicus]